MDNMWVLFIIIAIVLIVVAILSTVIGYFWASSVTKSTLLKQLEEKNDAAYKKAQEQLQEWKEKELAPIQKQIYDAAKGRAIQEMQEQVKSWQENELKQIRQQMQAGLQGEAIKQVQDQVRNWQENDLKQIRQQMLAGLQGEAIKEAQEQLVKWRIEELENAKRQIWDVLSKEATMNLEKWKVEAEKEIRADASANASTATGKITEHIVPYLPGFGFNPADARFVGSPIDMMVFDGLGDNDVKRVVFVSIKTGASSLSNKEKMIRDAVLARKVEWVEIIKANTEGPEVVNKIRTRKNTGSLIFEESEINSAVPPPTPNK